MSFEAEDFEALTKHLERNQPTEPPAPVYGDYLSTAMAHAGIFDQVEQTLVAITGSDETEAKSPVFAKLCLKRYTKTGRFNTVIAGEMASETGEDLETIVSADGFRFQRTRGYFNRLPWDYLGKDGDLIDGIHFSSKKKKKK